MLERSDLYRASYLRLCDMQTVKTYTVSANGDADAIQRAKDRAAIHGQIVISVWRCVYALEESDNARND